MEINFDESTHTYTNKKGKVLISTTQLLALAGIGANYDKVDSELLKSSAEKGIAVHKEIEEYIKYGVDGFTDAQLEFAKFIHKNKLKPIASEKIVSDGNIAGTIDCVLEDINGDLTLVDFKTTSVIHKESVSWQTSIYKYLWEKCEKRPIKNLQVFHFLNNGKLEIGNVKIVSAEKIKDLINWYLAKTENPFELSLLNQEQIALKNKTIEIIKNSKAQLEEAEKQLDKIKDLLVKAMKENGLSKYEDENIILSLVAPITKTTLDTKRLKAEKPKLYESYCKETTTAEQIRLKIKGEKEND